MRRDRDNANGLGIDLNGWSASGMSRECVGNASRCFCILSSSKQCFNNKSSTYD